MELDCGDVSTGCVEVLEEVEVEEEVVAGGSSVTAVDDDDVISSSPTVRNRSQMYPLGRPSLGSMASCSTVRSRLYNSATI